MPTFGYAVIRIVTSIVLVCLSTILTCPTAVAFSFGQLVTQDGPPSYHVDVTQIPNATPKYEPKSILGNPKSYMVDGQDYYVLESSRGYQAIGTASWYGSKFHGKPTSNGETYNMYAMTAASRELPLPSYVRVTNLTNGKEVIVRVNDRGPFYKNRIIDLSYAAAQKLGMLNNGTAHVRLEAISVDPPPEVDHHPKRELYLQIGAFNQQANALRESKRIQAVLTNMPVNVQTNDNSQHKLYRVMVGPIKNLAMNNHAINLLKQAGFANPYPIRQ